MIHILRHSICVYPLLEVSCFLCEQILSPQMLTHAANLLTVCVCSFVTASTVVCCLPQSISMSATEFILRLTIESATALPKTDTFSKIDPYIVITVNGQTFQTKIFQDDEEPVWNGERRSH